MSENYGDLCDYCTGAFIRAATKAERDAGRDAAESYGGSGVILLDASGELVNPHEYIHDEHARCYVCE
jgi:hypothetical protein